MIPIRNLANVAGVRRWRSRTELRAHQERAVRALVRHAYDRVPHYRELFDRAGFRPDQLRTLDDVARVPFTGKDDLRGQPPERVLAAGSDVRKLKRLQTTGSSGQPLIIYRSRVEDWIAKLRWYRIQREAGQRLGDRAVQIANVGNAGASRGLLSQITGALGLSNVMVDVSQDADAILDKVLAARPAVLVGYPGILARLGEDYRRSGRSDLRPRGLVAGGEVMTDARRRQILESFDAPVFELYACWEAGPLAFQCKTSRLLHLCADGAILEVVQGNRHVAPGERGELVLTYLYNRTMPLIRYRLGDIVTLGPSICPCGQPFATVSAVQGRMFDFFRLPSGRLLHPYEIALRLEKEPWYKQYQLVQEREDLIRIYIEPGAGFSAEQLAAFEQRVLGVLDGEARLVPSLVERIEPAPSGKFHIARSLLDAGGVDDWYHSAPAERDLS